MYKETEKFLDMTSPGMMKECGNKDYDDNDVNETDANINDMNESKGTWPDITSPAFMMEYED